MLWFYSSPRLRPGVFYNITSHVSAKWCKNCAVQTVSIACGKCKCCFCQVSEVRKLLTEGSTFFSKRTSSPMTACLEMCIFDIPKCINQSCFQRFAYHKYVCHSFYSLQCSFHFSVPFVLFFPPFNLFRDIAGQKIICIIFTHHYNYYHELRGIFIEQK